MGILYMIVVLSAMTVMAFVYRWSERRGTDRMAMLAAMGVAAGAWIAAWAALGGIRLGAAHPSQWAVGAALGVLVVVGTPLFMAAVARGDLSITWTLLTLSFPVASVASMIYPGERPTATGVAGLLTAAVAVALLGLDMHWRGRAGGASKPKRGWWLFMSLAFVVNAGNLYSYKLAETLAKGSDGGPSNTAAFLLTTYAVLAASAVAAALAGGRRGRTGIALGAGAINGSLLAAGGFFLVMALGVGTPAYLIFPITNGGSNLLVAALSFVFLKERPGAFGWAGIAAGVASFVLLGIAMPR